MDRQHLGAAEAIDRRRAHGLRSGLHLATSGDHAGLLGSCQYAIRLDQLAGSDSKGACAKVGWFRAVISVPGKRSSNALIASVVRTWLAKNWKFTTAAA